MNQNSESQSLSQAVAECKKKCGNTLLDNDEMLLLAADAILSSYTFEEKGYA